MAATVLDLPALKSLSRDGRLLLVSRGVRLFGYGLLSIVLVLYLAALGLSEARIGLLLTLTLAGDTAVSLLITTAADRVGRKRMLVAGALLLFAAAMVFRTADTYWLLLLAATVGVISPSGNEVGPFLSIEQASLSQIVSGRDRTAVFACYHLLGAIATALGALVGGSAAGLLRRRGWTSLESFRAIITAYAACGLILAGLFLLLTHAVELPSRQHPVEHRILFGLHTSKRLVLRLSSLFALDAFAGGFVVQSIAAYWFHLRFQAQPSTLGAIFFGANLLAALSALAAVPLARRIGLIDTMVFTHVPSNVLLALVPLMPTLPLAATVLLLRFSISQMDVPTRQAYTMAVVEPDERSAASGITGVARTAGAAVSPSLAAMLLGVPALIGVPFFAAGGLKLLYDGLLWRSFRELRPPDERARLEREKPGGRIQVTKPAPPA